MRKRFLTPALILLLASCAATSDPKDYPRIASADDRWGVGVADPVFASLAECEDDPSVESAMQSGDLPSSRLGFRLKAGASETDAVRVADCVARLLSGGELAIVSPDA